MSARTPAADGRPLSAAAKLERVRDLAAITSPVSLARRLDPTFVATGPASLISRAVVSAERGEHDRILVTTPPRVGKSTAAAVWSAFWWLARHPHHRVVVASYAASLAMAHGKAVRKLVKEHGERFGLVLERGSQAAQDWSLTTGGGMRCVGVDGGITGFGANLAIGDDLHKGRKEAESVKQRDNVAAFWSADFLSRLAPGAPVIVSMTLWHPDDIAGRVLEDEGQKSKGGRWYVLKCPAFATAADDPLGRAIGDPLPHPLIPPEDTEALRSHWEDKKRTSPVRAWNALYMCDPQPHEGALLTAAQCRAARQYDGLPARVNGAVAVDPSGDGRDTAGIVGGYLGVDGRLYVMEDATGVMKVNEWARAACELAARMNAGAFIVETNFGGGMGPALIRTAWDALKREHDEEHADDPDAPPNPYERFCPRLKKSPARGSKADRADPVAQQVIEGRIKFGTYMPELESEWQNWQPQAESPGRIDAMVHLAAGMLRPPKTGKATKSPATVDRRDVARRDVGGGPRINRPGVG